MASHHAHRDSGRTFPSRSPRKQRRRLSVSRAAFAAGVLAAAAAIASGQDYSWQGGLGPNAWSNAANWIGGVVPENANTVTIADDTWRSPDVAGGSHVMNYLQFNGYTPGGPQQGTNGISIESTGALTSLGCNIYGTQSYVRINGGTFSAANNMSVYADRFDLSLESGRIESDSVYLGIGLTQYTVTLDATAGPAVWHNTGDMSFSWVAGAPTGTVTVRNGARLEVGGKLSINSTFGSADCYVQSGAVLQTARLSVGDVVGSGTLHVSDATVGASQWISIGAGAAEITNGGSVLDSGLTVGNTVGTLSISGVSATRRSSWSTLGDAYFGGQHYHDNQLVGGHGYANVTNGGLMTTTGTAQLGAFGGSYGEVNVGGFNADGSRSMWDVDNLLLIGSGEGEGVVQISDGGLVQAPVQTVVGQAGVGTGILSVSGVNTNGVPSVLSTNELIVGNSGTGYMPVDGGGQVINGGNALLGNFANSYGVASVTGEQNANTPSIWTNDGDLHVGVGGSGGIYAQDGGAIRNVNGFIAENGSSNSFAVVRGASPTGGVSSWQNLGDLTVGGLGVGTMGVYDGGLVTDLNAYVGRGTDAIIGGLGIVRVGGGSGLQPSRWQSTQNLVIGNRGAGRVSIDSGGVVYAGALTLGAQAGSSGTLTIGAPTGSGPLPGGILNAPSVTVGAGAGTLQFNHTATQASPLYFTRDGTAGGTPVLITGNTTVVNDGGYTVLTGANDHLGGTIINGGTLQIGNGGTSGSIFGSSTNNALLVFDRGDNYSYGGIISGSGAVEKIGAGNLSLTFGAHSYAGQTIVHDGTLTLQGGSISHPGSSFLVAAATGETAWLTVMSAGKITDASAVIGKVTGSVGSATVTGDNSRWISGNAMYVGDGGAGALSVLSGASVTTSLVFVANGANSTGAINVDGGSAGPSLLTADFMQVGVLGAATVNITNGGLVQSGADNLGLGTGSSGTALVAGLNSAWQHNDGLVVGNAGTGVLTVQDRGRVTSVLTSVAYAPGSAGIINIGAAAADAAQSPGLLGMPEIRGGLGAALLQFNHLADGSNPYYFTSTGQSTGASSAITGTLRVEHNAGFTVFNNSADTYTGGTTVNAGTLRAGAAGALPDNTGYTVNGGELDLNGFSLIMSSLSGSGGTVNLGGAQLTVDQSVDTSFAGSISGTTKVIKSGAGKLELTGASSYGQTIVRGGVLSLRGSGAIVNSTGALSVADQSTSSGEVLIRDNAQLVGSVVSLIGEKGDGSLTVQSGGSITAPEIWLAYSNEFFTKGTVNIGAAANETAAAPGVLKTQKVLGWSETGTSVIQFNHTGTASNACWFTNTGQSTGTPILVSGFTHAVQTAGYTVLNASANTFTGGTTIDGGTLHFTSGALGPSGSIQLSGGSLRWAVGNTQDISSRLVLSGDGTIDPNSNSVTFAGNITGTGGFHLHQPDGAYTNTLNLNGASTYQGGTTVEAHSVLNVNNATGSATGTGPVTVDFLGTLGGAGTIAGDTTIAGLLAPGNSPGTIHFGGDVTFTGQSQLEFELGGLMRGTEYDAIDIAGAATMQGDIIVRQYNGYVPLPGEHFDVVTFGSRIGDPQIINGTTFAGLRFDKNYSAGGLTLLPMALGGDATLDGTVDLADFSLLAAAFNLSGQTWLSGDFTNDAVVNLADFAILGANFNTSLPAGRWAPPTQAEITAAVPEPTGLLSLAGLCLAGRRRRRA